MKTNEILGAVKGSPNGSGGGSDALRPQHLKDMLGCLKDELSNHLCQALAALVTHMFKGGVPAEVFSYLYGAKLVASKTKDGGTIPIAVGQTVR